MSNDMDMCALCWIARVAFTTEERTIISKRPCHERLFQIYDLFGWTRRGLRRPLKVEAYWKEGAY